jgi:hypothetical protein
MAPETVLLLLLAGGFATAGILVVSMWTIFAKAGQPGWAALVPILNAIVLLEVVGRPRWWVLVLGGVLVPYLACPLAPVALVLCVILCRDLAVSFGKGWGYAVGLVGLGFVFFPLLAFGDATYRGPAAGAPWSAA